MRQCPKCEQADGGDWAQCEGACPMPMSPHFADNFRFLYHPESDSVWCTQDPEEMGEDGMSIEISFLDAVYGGEAPNGE